MIEIKVKIIDKKSEYFDNLGYLDGKVGRLFKIRLEDDNENTRHLFYAQEFDFVDFEVEEKK